MVDVLTNKMLANYKKSAYGSAKVWATVALGPGSLLCGMFMDKIGNDAIFWWSGVTGAVVIAVVYLFDPDHIRTSDTSLAAKKRRSVPEILTAFVENTKDSRIAFVLVHSFIFGFVMTLLES
eukprot:CAMPEP_0175168870 /NCGR_PEP_ID=MMETSP0087-20121206/29222_1 /TAXON_ID=136419 /ORGANISM="Unknown Unknown, Strain D1" /LENGTH=121 /DNA_ID=CAMNT_0016459087 /DNA_START=163 /DNA_END=525 /DNA_ORIENTATION=+